MAANEGMQEPPRSSPPDRAHGVDPKLLDLLVCPLTKTSLDYDPVRQELISRVARLAFPIRDGVPMMTVEAARRLDSEDEAYGSHSG